MRDTPIILPLTSSVDGLAIIPFPRDELTPPVTKMYLVCEDIMRYKREQI